MTTDLLSATRYDTLKQRLIERYAHTKRIVREAVFKDGRPPMTVSTTPEQKRAVLEQLLMTPEGFQQLMQELQFRYRLEPDAKKQIEKVLNKAYADLAELRMAQEGPLPQEFAIGQVPLEPGGPNV